MWIETSKEVAAVIFARHKPELKPMASFTDPDGTSEISSGYPEMSTDWGFENAKNPLLRVLQTKKHKDQKEWDFSYFLHKN